MATARELGITSPQDIGKVVGLQDNVLRDAILVDRPDKFNRPDNSPFSDAPWEVTEVNHTVFFAQPIVISESGHPKKISTQQRMFSLDEDILEQGEIDAET